MSLPELALSSTLPPTVSLLVPSTSQRPINVCTKKTICSGGPHGLGLPPQGHFPTSQANWFLSTGNSFSLSFSLPSNDCLHWVTADIPASLSYGAGVAACSSRSLEVHSLFQWLLTPVTGQMIWVYLFWKTVVFVSFSYVIFLNCCLCCSDNSGLMPNGVLSKTISSHNSQVKTLSLLQPSFPKHSVISKKEHSTVSSR